MRLLGAITFVLGASVAIACSSGGGGGGGVPCDDAGLCGGGQVCQNGYCVNPNVGGGGGMGGGMGGGTANACPGACAKAATANCPNQAGCLSNCESGRSQIPPSCTSQFDAMINCIATKGSPTCDADGDPDFNVPTGACDGEENSVSTCINSGTGGFGGGDGGMGGGGFGGGGMGGGGFGGGGMGGGGSGGTGGSNPCADCAQSSCYSELSACQSNTACMSIIQCVGNCTDQACFDYCVTSNPSGSSAFNAFYGCLSEMCYTECS